METEGNEENEGFKVQTSNTQRTTDGHGGPLPQPLSHGMGEGEPKPGNSARAYGSWCQQLSGDDWQEKAEELEEMLRAAASR